MDWADVLVGALVGGGSLTAVLILALTERMRAKFLSREEGVTRGDLAQREERQRVQFAEALEKVTADVRTAVHTEVNSVGLRVERDMSNLQRQLDGVGRVVDQALRQSLEADRKSTEALHKGEVLAAQVQSSREHLDTKLAHLEDLIRLGMPNPGRKAAS